MSETDFWYLSPFLGFQFDSNDNLPLPQHHMPKVGERGLFLQSDFSPVSRLIKTYGLRKLDASNLLRVARQYILDYEVRTNYLGDSDADVSDEEDNLLSEGVVGDSFVDFGRSYNSPFLLSAWTVNFIEKRTNFVTWHNAGNHTVHIENIDFNCGCEKPKLKRYFGPDPLTREVILALCLNLPIHSGRDKSYNLPIVGPRDDVEARLKVDIENKLDLITKNKVARELPSSRTVQESKNLANDIFSMVPYQPKVAAALYQGAN